MADWTLTVVDLANQSRGDSESRHPSLGSALLAATDAERQKFSVVNIKRPDGSVLDGSALEAALNRFKAGL